MSSSSRRGGRKSSSRGSGADEIKLQTIQHLVLSSVSKLYSTHAFLLEQPTACADEPSALLAQAERAVRQAMEGLARAREEWEEAILRKNREDDDEEEDKNAYEVPSSVRATEESSYRPSQPQAQDIPPRMKPNWEVALEELKDRIMRPSIRSDSSSAPWADSGSRARQASSGESSLDSMLQHKGEYAAVIDSYLDRRVREGETRSAAPVWRREAEKKEEQKVRGGMEGDGKALEIMGTDVGLDFRGALTWQSWTSARAASKACEAAIERAARKAKLRQLFEVLDQI